MSRLRNWEEQCDVIVDPFHPIAKLESYASEKCEVKDNGNS